MKILNLIFSTLLIGSFCFLDEVECILNGELVDLEDIAKFKYEIGILATKVSEPFVCGGGILDDYHILTAAHCFAAKTDTGIPDHKRITVIAHTLSNRIAVNEGSIVRKVAKVFIPSSYFQNGYADIAIIKVTESFNLNRNAHKLQALQLPESNFATEGLDAYVAGYGVHAINNGVTESDGRLRTMDVEIVADEVLDDLFISGKPSDSIPGYPRGFCSGDSGSPLVIGNGENIKIIGTVRSNSKVCDDTSRPGVYMRVSAYLDSFIYKVLRDRIDQTIIVKDFSSFASCFSG